MPLQSLRCVRSVLTFEASCASSRITGAGPDSSTFNTTRDVIGHRTKLSGSASAPYHTADRIAIAVSFLPCRFGRTIDRSIGRLQASHQTPRVLAQSKRQMARLLPHIQLLSNTANCADQFVHKYLQHCLKRNPWKVILVFRDSISPTDLTSRS